MACCETCYKEQQKMEEVLWALQNMVRKHCKCAQREYASDGVPANTVAIDLLIKYGRMELRAEENREVSAAMIHR